MFILKRIVRSFFGTTGIAGKVLKVLSFVSILRMLTRTVK